jgi:hypothetical protein
VVYLVKQSQLRSPENAKFENLVFSQLLIFSKQGTLSMSFHLPLNKETESYDTKLLAQTVDNRILILEGKFITLRTRVESQKLRSGEGLINEIDKLKKEMDSEIVKEITKLKIVSKEKYIALRYILQHIRLMDEAGLLPLIQEKSDDEVFGKLVDRVSSYRQENSESTHRGVACLCNRTGWCTDTLNKEFRKEAVNDVMVPSKKFKTAIYYIRTWQKNNSLYELIAIIAKATKLYSQHCCWFSKYKDDLSKLKQSAKKLKDKEKTKQQQGSSIINSHKLN